MSPPPDVAKNRSQLLITAILLIGHGSRVVDANAALLRVAGMVARQGDFQVVEVAYCELQPPDIQAGIDACMGRGARRIVLSPYFLFAGAHVLRDLPAEAERAVRRHPGLEVVIAAPLGDHPRLAEVVCERAVAAVRAAGWEAGVQDRRRE